MKYSVQKVSGLVERERTKHSRGNSRGTESKGKLGYLSIIEHSEEYPVQPATLHGFFGVSH